MIEKGLHKEMDKCSGILLNQGPLVLAAVSGTEKWATKPSGVPSKWAVRGRCFWAEQRLGCLAWTLHSLLHSSGEEKPFGDSRGTASDILLGQTSFKLMAER